MVKSQLGIGKKSAYGLVKSQLALAFLFLKAAQCVRTQRKLVSGLALFQRKNPGHVIVNMISLYF